MPTNTESTPDSVVPSALYRQVEDIGRQMVELEKEFRTEMSDLETSILVFAQDAMEKFSKRKEKRSALVTSPAPFPSVISTPQGLAQAGSQPMGARMQSNQETGGGATMALFPDGAKEKTSQAPVFEADQVSAEESMQKVSVLLQEIRPVTEDSTFDQIEPFVQEFTKVVGISALTSHQKFQAFGNKSKFCRESVTFWKELDFRNDNFGNDNFEKFMEFFLGRNRIFAPKRSPHNLSLLSLRQTGSLVEYFENFTILLELAGAAYRNDQIALDLFESGLDNRLKKHLVFMERKDYRESYHELLCFELVAKENTGGRKAEKGQYASQPAPSEGIKCPTISSSRKRNRSSKKSENNGRLTKRSICDQNGPRNRPISLQGTAFSQQESEPTTPDTSTDDGLIDSCLTKLDCTTATAPVKEKEKLFMVSSEDATALVSNRDDPLFNMQSFPMYLVTLAGQRFRALVHTGVSFNTIHPRVVEKTGITPVKTRSEESIMIGENISATGAVRLNLTLMNGRKIAAEFGVFESPFDFIFGAQLVDQVGLFVTPDGFHAEIEIEANISEFLSRSFPRMV